MQYINKILILVAIFKLNSAIAMPECAGKIILNKLSNIVAVQTILNGDGENYIYTINNSGEGDLPYSIKIFNEDCRLISEYKDDNHPVSIFTLDDFQDRVFYLATSANTYIVKAFDAKHKYQILLDAYSKTPPAFSYSYKNGSRKINVKTCIERCKIHILD